MKLCACGCKKKWDKNYRKEYDRKRYIKRKKEGGGKLLKGYPLHKTGTFLKARREMAGISDDRYWG